MGDTKQNIPENRIITVQIPTEMYDKLKEMAKEDCSSVSYIIRKAIIKTIREN